MEFIALMLGYIITATLGHIGITRGWFAPASDTMSPLLDGYLLGINFSFLFTVMMFAVFL